MGAYLHQNNLNDCLNKEYSISHALPSSLPKVGTKKNNSFKGSYCISEGIILHIRSVINVTLLSF